MSYVDLSNKKGSGKEVRKWVGRCLKVLVEEDM